MKPVQTALDEHQRRLVAEIAALIASDQNARPVPVAELCNEADALDEQEADR